MADKSYGVQNKDQHKTITVGKLTMVIKANVDSADTVTISELSGIDVVTAVVLSTGADALATNVGNVVTIDAGDALSLSNEDVLILVSGTKA